MLGPAESLVPMQFAVGRYPAEGPWLRFVRSPCDEDGPKNCSRELA
jgi:hypothetical protein